VTSSWAVGHRSAVRPARGCSGQQSSKRNKVDSAAPAASRSGGRHVGRTSRTRGVVAAVAEARGNCAPTTSARTPDDTCFETSSTKLWPLLCTAIILTPLPLPASADDDDDSDDVFEMLYRSLGQSAFMVRLHAG